MGDRIKTYEVTVVDSLDPNKLSMKIDIHAGSLSFTVSGDLVFEDENRNFQESYAKGAWLHVREIREAN